MSDGTGGEASPNPLSDADTEVVDLKASEFSDAEFKRLSAPRDPSDNPIPQQREKTRIWLSKFVLMATGATALTSILAGLLNVDNPEVVTGAFTGLVGLSGTVLGFYFGGSDRSV